MGEGHDLRCVGRKVDCHRLPPIPENELAITVGRDAQRTGGQYGTFRLIIGIAQAGKIAFHLCHFCVADITCSVVVTVLAVGQALQTAITQVVAVLIFTQALYQVAADVTAMVAVFGGA